MVEICAVASGSNGNCYYIGDENEAILIDAGITCKQIITRMISKGLDPKKLKAVFITHEHNDHVCGARVLGKKLDLPIYMTKGTYNGLYRTSVPQAVRFVQGGEAFPIGSFRVHPVPKQHDAKEPTSFRVEVEGWNIGVFTDIGAPCDKVKHHLNQCEVLFLETNYDEKMLWNGSYPYPLKTRVASDHGHLSNDQAVDLLENHANNNLRWVFLSHLSAENNTPEIALQALSHLKDRYELILTSRYEPGNVLKLSKQI